jgi:hypothetical protein
VRYNWAAARSALRRAEEEVATAYSHKIKSSQLLAVLRLPVTFKNGQ